MDTKRFGNKLTLKILRHQGIDGYGHKSEEIDNSSDKVDNISSAKEEASLGGIASSSTIIQEDKTVIESQHPERPAITLNTPPQGFKRWRNTIKRHFLVLREVTFHKKTPAEQAEAKYQAKKRQLENQIIVDSNNFWKVISNRLTDFYHFDLMASNNEAFLNSRAGKKAIRRKVKADIMTYDLIEWPPKIDDKGLVLSDGTVEGGNRIIFHIDSRIGMLPGGDAGRIKKIISPDNVDELEYAVGCPVKAWANGSGGFIEVFRTRNQGIPDLVTVQDMWARMPESLPSLCLPIGVGENGKPIYRNLAEYQHLLIVGSTGQGKSNMINVILTTFIQRNPADKLKLVLFDLKGGVEFSLYRKLPHILNAKLDDKVDDPEDQHYIPGIVQDMDETIGALKYLQWEMKARMERIREAECKDVDEYNLHHPNSRIPRIVVVFDDFIAVSLFYKDEVNNPLIHLSSQCRAAGMYLILGAQYPKSDYFPSVITVNFPAVIAFRLKPGASNSMLGSHAAVDLHPKGRCILHFSDDEQIQTPRITTYVVKRVINNAISGKSELVEDSLGIDEILQWALKERDGWLKLNDVFDHYKKQKHSYHEIHEILQAADEQLFEIDGQAYTVKREIQEGTKSLTRRVVLAEMVEMSEKVKIPAQS